MARGFGSTLGAGTTDRSTSQVFTLPTSFSWAMWQNRHGSGGGGTGRLFQKGTGTHQVYSYNVDPTFIRFDVTWSSAAGQWQITRPAADTWHHVAVTYDGASTANNPVMYLDGVSQSVTETSTPSGTWTPASTGVTVGNDPTGIRVWDGMHAEFGLWGRILTAGEIAGLALGATPEHYPSGLLSYIDMVDPLRDLVLGAMTTTGTVVQPHPRVILPRYRSARGPLAVVSAGHGPLLAGYRNRLVIA